MVMAKVNRRVLIVLAVLALAALACNVLSGLTGSGTPEASLRTVTIQSVTGGVEVRNADGTFEAASAGRQLALGEEVHTFADGRAVLEMDDGTVVVIAEDTLFQVKQLEGEPDTPVTRFFVNAGEVFSFRDGTLPEGASYEVETPNGIAAVRGSSMGVGHGRPAQDCDCPTGTPRLTADVTRVTCLEGTCSAAVDEASADLTDGDAITINIGRLLGGVEAMTDADFARWLAAIMTAQNAGFLGGFPIDVYIPPTPTPTLPTGDGVPNLVGLTTFEAELALAQLGIFLNVVNSSLCINVDAGQITSQFPEAGAPLEDVISVDVVECLGRPGTGDVQVTLTWGETADVDLIVTDPNFEDVAYYSTVSTSGGQLDVDANAYCDQPLTTSPVENVFWPVDSAPSGEYIVRVVYSIECSSEGPVDYVVTITVDGETQEYTGTISPGEDIQVTSFTR